MDKLIDLLNEYEKQFTDRPNYFWYKDKMLWKYIFCELNWRNIDNQELMIISERYEFISWLVEKWKIDFSLIPNKIKEIWIPMKINWEIKYWFDSSDYYWLLMLLSIQDNPIEFLCSVLN